jgi:hypothetical protein
MIDDPTESVVITTYGSTDERRRVAVQLEQLRQGTPEARLILRRLQPYLVSVRSRDAEQFRQEGMISPIMDQLGEWMGNYDRVRGLVTEPEHLDTLIV